MQELSKLCLWLTISCVTGGCSKMVEYDLLIRNGEIYDGSGRAPFRGDIAINGDTIAEIGDLPAARGRTEIDARGLAVAPGFINMMSWANESLIADGRSQSEIRQGVTLEVLGEGNSMGPLNDKMKADEKERQGDIQYDIEWSTLREYLDYLVRRGVSCNVASFVGAATVRIHEIGHENRRPTAQELERMKALVRQAMEEGAVGLSSALIYAPGCYADTEELLELAKVAAEYDGLYASHLRSESEQLLEALDEFLSIARQAKIRAEVYHIKASGRRNWHKLDAMLGRIEAARAEGLHVTADMYTYHASATGLDSIMPPWVQEGGHRAWVERLKDPAIREKVKQEMRMTGNAYDNGLIAAGSADNIILIGFRSEALKPLTGMTLAEVAAQRGRSPEDTAIDLIIEDDSRVGAAFFTMSEDNVRKEIRQPWISFCSDSASQAPEGVFLKRNPHPRAYGSFARLLGKYVREEKLICLTEAIRRLTWLPAENMRLDRRGRLSPGYFADIVVFDPATIIDRATFKQPHQYATGVRDVFVNGVQVLRNGEHTGAKPGRVVCGPGVRKG
ncbi:MAG TPA: D-aminoacylase [Phycisphaerae bacterium]|nr:D-aminoacylase [Phycisphaerae bacterium]HRR84904.1 D-aminoacylase [Phycisphaerae bacterium]